MVLHANLVTTTINSEEGEIRLCFMAIFVIASRHVTHLLFFFDIVGNKRKKHDKLFCIKRAAILCLVILNAVFSYTKPCWDIFMEQHGRYFCIHS